MTLIADGNWKLSYQSDGTDLVRSFYEPLLEDAIRYDRTSGYFDAKALTLAARGVEGLVRNGGRMRLLVGCTLDPGEIAAIEQGELIRDRVRRKLEAIQLVPFDEVSHNALELLAWLIAHDVLDVRVGIPCDDEGRPISDTAIFHLKFGIVEDRHGDRLAFNGSLNETEAGWRYNWEMINVFLSTHSLERVEQHERLFQDLWEGRQRHLLVLDVPSAIREKLLRFLPANGQKPVRLRQRDDAELRQRRNQLAPLVWSYIRSAALQPDGGRRVGEATAAFKPWPHQVRAFGRLYDRWPPRLLIADEVGLGKTIQAGMLLRQAVLSGRARRVLILAPKAVLRQWQLELREKFNLYWPIYDGQRLTWCKSPVYPQGRTIEVDDYRWCEEPYVIMGSQLARLSARARVLIEVAAPWDLILLDEAHHARRKGAGGTTDKGPNALLRLMQKLSAKTSGLVLLTATPMQVHPREIWDLLNLLGLPPSWDEAAFLGYFEKLAGNNLSFENFEHCVRLFQEVERQYGETTEEEAANLIKTGRFQAKKWIRQLRGDAVEPRRQAFLENRKELVRLLQRSSPIRRLVSRHTRDLLRRYFQEGKLHIQIAQRRVRDEFIEMTPEERSLYQDLEDFISITYRMATSEEKQAVGFIMTIYRRRLASSFEALRQTLLRHKSFALNDEDAPDEDVPDDYQEAFEEERIEKIARKMQEQIEIDMLLNQLSRLPVDSKFLRLLDVLRQLKCAGHERVMVFTQYADTLDFLRKRLLQEGYDCILCFSGRGGEVQNPDGTLTEKSRDEIKRIFREGRAEVMLCTDAAAEGLNFQFCSALINYDMPWNPMRVEQRIGRIDRLGQVKPCIDIVNLHYRDTVETDIYYVLRDRIQLFENFVGKLQPILSRLSGHIRAAVLNGQASALAGRQLVIEQLKQEVIKEEETGFDLDDVAGADLEMPHQAPPAMTVHDLHRVLRNPSLMLPEAKVLPLAVHRAEYSLEQPGVGRVRVTTDPFYYEENADSVELWTPGSPVFIGFAENLPPPPPDATLEQLLNRLGV